MSENPSALDLTVDALAVFRLTRLAGEDTIFDRPREWAVMNGPDWARDLLTCPHCLSIYMGAGAVVMRTMAPRLWKPLSRVLALSALTSLKTEYFETFGQ